MLYAFFWQDTFDYSKNSASRKLKSTPLLLSSFTAEVTTPYLVSYSSIITSTPELPIESINAPVLGYKIQTPGNYPEESIQQIKGAFPPRIL